MRPPVKKVGKCFVTEHFYPYDFTPSSWNGDAGELEESTASPVHLNPRTVLVDLNLQLIIPKYRPHDFSDIDCAIVSGCDEAVFAPREREWIAAHEGEAPGIVCDVEFPHRQFRVEDIAEEPDAVFSGAEDSPPPATGTYPHWTMIDSGGRGTYYPQIGDRIVYIREGHLAMDSSLNDLWPEIGFFEVRSVIYAFEYCDIELIPISVVASPDLGAQVQSAATAEADTSSLRHIRYCIESSPFFMIPLAMFETAMNVFCGISNGDIIKVCFRKYGNDVQYSGQILSKSWKTGLYESLEVQWKDGDEIDWVSPWELSFWNGATPYEDGPPHGLFANQCKSVRRVLEAARGSRPVRSLFKQCRFMPGVLHPVDLGLILRRLRNGFYRHNSALKFDVSAFESVQKVVASCDENLVRIMVKRLNSALEDPESAERLANFEEIEAEVEHLRQEQKREIDRVMSRPLNKKVQGILSGVYEFMSESDGGRGDSDEFEGQSDDDDEDFVMTRQSERSVKRRRFRGSGKTASDDDFVWNGEGKVSDSDFEGKLGDDEVTKSVEERKNKEEMGKRSGKTRVFGDDIMVFGEAEEESGDEGDLGSLSKRKVKDQSEWNGRLSGERVDFDFVERGEGLKRRSGVKRVASNGVKGDLSEESSELEQTNSE
jgi:hypothetical protein